MMYMLAVGGPYPGCFRHGMNWPTVDVSLGNALGLRVQRHITIHDINAKRPQLLVQTTHNQVGLDGGKGRGWLLDDFAFPGMARDEGEMWFRLLC